MIRVLVIDDNITFAQTLSAGLSAKRGDLIIDPVGTAESALRLIRETDYDVIISDVCMPRLNGFRLLEQTKVLRPFTPVVLITGYGDRELEDQATQSGAYAFVHKPVDADVLASVVSRAVLKAKVRRNVEHSQDLFLQSQKILNNIQKMTERLQRTIRDSQV